MGNIKLYDHDLIQGKWKPKVRDIIITPGGEGVVCSVNSVDFYVSINETLAFCRRDVSVWKPSSEDLIKLLMAEWGNCRPYKVLDIFCDWYDSPQNKGTDYGTEEYFLHFYMHTNGLKWTGEEWEK